MHRSIGIAIALLLGIRGALYLWAAWRWTQDRRAAWGPLGKRKAP